MVESQEDKMGSRGGLWFLTGTKKTESNVQIGGRVTWEWSVPPQLTELDKMDDWAQHCKVATKRN